MLGTRSSDNTDFVTRDNLFTKSGGSSFGVRLSISLFSQKTFVYTSDDRVLPVKAIFLESFLNKPPSLPGEVISAGIVNSFPGGSGVPERELNPELDPPSPPFAIFIGSRTSLISISTISKLL
jgi:hypothetical protein